MLRASVYKSMLINQQCTLRTSTISKSPLQVIQRRSYIFVPSISEIYKIIYESFFCKEHSQKTLIIQKNKVKKKYKTICDSYQFNRQEFLNNYKQRRKSSYLLQRFEHYNLLGKIQQQRLLFSNYVIKHKTRSKLRYYKYKERYLNEIQVIPMKEPIESTWFDEEGYPLTSRDSITGRFINPWQSRTGNGTHSLWKFLSWKWQRFWRSRNHTINATNDVSPLTACPNDKIKLTWIGHSTCYVQMSNFTILTDPMFSHRASLFQSPGMGVARSVPPSHSLQYLPSIDIVVISHDHYDHLDYHSIVGLVDKVQYWCVPLGMKEWLIENIDMIDGNKIIELEWWQSITLYKDREGKIGKNKTDEEVKVTCAPAHHWSCRSPFDRNLRLWCSWALSTPSLNFYFAGDTAYPQHFPLHSQITTKLGPFDLSAIPIGAYEPSFFMKDSHCNPIEAVKIHEDLNSNKSVAIHWGTFPLADEELDDPPVVLKKALGGKDDFVVVRHGQHVLSS